MTHPLIANTIEFMMHAHAGQVDKAGKPYYLHPLRVMTRLTHPSAAMRHAALLHDVVEDTIYGIKYLEDTMGYSEDVLRMVDILTRRHGESHSAYIQRIIDMDDNRVVIIKLADLADNSSPARMAQLPESERGLAKRYAKDDLALRAHLIRRGYAIVPMISGDL